MVLNYRIHPIPLFISYVPKCFMTYLTNFYEVIPIGHYVWYIEGPKEKILVDAGFTLERAAARQKLIRRTEPIQTLEEGLKILGLRCDDIDLVILTHADHDHISSLRNFPNARKIIQRAELQFARDPHPIFKSWRPPDYAGLIDGLNFEVIEGDTRIDQGIDLVFTPGHTPGGQSVAVKTAEGLSVITGWCCIPENLYPPPEVIQRGLSSIPCGVHTDLLQCYESTEKVKSMADRIIAIHDIAFTNKATNLS